MAKVGQIVTIPTGSYCNITLDSGDKVVVNHEPGGRGGSGGRLAIDRLTLMVVARGRGLLEGGR